MTGGRASSAAVEGASQTASFSVVECTVRLQHTMATPSSSQGTQDAHQPEEVAVDRGALQLLFCTKQQASALLAVQQGVQGKAVGCGGRRPPCTATGVHRLFDACRFPVQSSWTCCAACLCASCIKVVITCAQWRE